MGANKHTQPTLHTPANQRLLIFAGVLLVLFLSILTTFFVPRSAGAAVGINERFTYQARLLNSQGATVPDGTYNMEFKIYQDGDGCASGGTVPCGGTLKWTETRTTTNRVNVTNGYFSVELGSVNPFGSSVDWNQDTLWLSINIGGTSGTPSWDGEMTPFRRLGATPYALNAKQLGGLDWSKFAQVAPSAAQIDSSTLSTLFLNKTGASGNILQLQKSGSDVFVVDNSGKVGLGITSPSYDLDINKTVAGDSVDMRIANQSASGFAEFNLESDTRRFILGTGGSTSSAPGTFYLYDATAGASRLAVNSTGNLGVGASSPASAIQVDKGTATASALKFTAGTTTGQTATDGLDIGITSTGVATINQRENLGLNFNTNNTQRLSISNTGDISIGTSDTTGNLLVLDTKTSSGDPTGTNGGMYYNSNTSKFRCYQGGSWSDCISAAGAPTTCSTSGTYICQNGNAFGSSMFIGTNDNTPVLIRTNNGSGPSINVNPLSGIVTVSGSSGGYLNADNLGIGSGLSATQAVTAIQVDKGTGAASTLKFTAGTTTGQTAADGLDVGILSDGTGLITQREAKDIGFATNNNVRMLIKADGTIGIGGSISTPANALHIDQGTGGAAVQITASATTGQTSSDGLQLTLDSSSNGYVINWENAPLYLGSNAAVGLSVFPGGIVGIGTGFTTPTNTLDVNGTVRVRTFGGATGTTVCRTTTGNAGVLSACTSSRRYKEDIKDINYGLDTVEQLHPVNFKWKDRDQRDIGFIAEEMAKSVPEVITYDDQGRIDGINYHLLTAVLTKAMQEQQVEINQLKNDTWKGGIVSKDTRFNADVLFNGPVKFSKSTTFTGDVKFKGKVVFDKNTAGTITIPKGRRSISVNLAKPVSSVPTVNATPQDFMQGSFRVKDMTKRGFTIELSQPQNKDVLFSWSALVTE